MRRSKFFLVVLSMVVAGFGAQVFASGPVAPKIPAGTFAPLFGLDKGQSSFDVGSFRLDATPVSNQDYAAFIDKNPEWRKGRVAEIFADSKYLKHWKGSRPESAQRLAPVVHVSWYSAAAYCEWRGGRLPTTLEWEYVAAASENKPNALKDAEFRERILTWYSKPAGQTISGKVGQTRANYYGVKDMHALVWEWTSDFNSFFVTADNRQDGDKIKNLFCGNGAIGAADRENYAAFMRYAFRSSLNANFNLGSLGFRCAYDEK